MLENTQVMSLVMESQTQLPVTPYRTIASALHKQDSPGPNHNGKSIHVPAGVQGRVAGRPLGEQRRQLHGQQEHW